MPKKAGYKVVEKTPPHRDKAMLARPNPLNEDVVDPYDMVAPGLYPDETLVQLDIGESVAVSVESRWMSNGEGLFLAGYCRWVNEDGSTKTDSWGQPVETRLLRTVGNDTLALPQHDAASLATELSRLMLGEEPTVIQTEGENSTQTTLLQLPQNHVECGSIRAAIRCVKGMTKLKPAL